MKRSSTTAAVTRSIFIICMMIIIVRFYKSNGDLKAEIAKLKTSQQVTVGSGAHGTFSTLDHQATGMTFEKQHGELRWYRKISGNAAPALYVTLDLPPVEINGTKVQIPTEADAYGIVGPEVLGAPY